jgi:hypothetical protein
MVAMTSMVSDFVQPHFEALRPLVATTNSVVVTRAINVEGRETNYYEIINKILEFSFAENKELKVVFFDCDWFDNYNGTRQNQFSTVEVKHNEWLWRYDTFILAHQVEQVYYLPYPCKKLSAWWVVHKVNPCEWLHTSGDAGYHDTPTLDDDVYEVYQEEELPPSFIIDLGAGFDDLVGDVDDIQMVVQISWCWWILKLSTSIIFIHNFFHLVHFVC